MVLVVLMVKIFVPVQQVEEGAGGDSKLQIKNRKIVKMWLLENEL